MIFGNEQRRIEMPLEGFGQVQRSGIPAAMAFQNVAAAAKQAGVRVRDAISGMLASEKDSSRHVTFGYSKSRPSARQSHSRL